MNELFLREFQHIMNKLHSGIILIPPNLWKMMGSGFVSRPPV